MSSRALLSQVGPGRPRAGRDFFRRAVALELSFFEAAYAGGPMEASDVDCAAEAPQSGLMECLGQGWVGVDGPGHVLEKSPHFDRQCELSNEFRNMGADRLDAEHAMIVAAGDHANESAVFPRLHA